MPADHLRGWSTSWRGPVAAYRRALTAKGRAAEGRVAIEGLRLVERALRAEVALDCVIASQAVAQAPSRWPSQVVAQLAAAGVDRVVAPDEVVGELVGGRTFGELVAVARRPPPLDLAALAGDGPVSILAVCDVLDPGNVGALARTALAFGAAGMLVVRGADPFHPKALRTSMGALFRLPMLRADRVDIIPDVVRIGLATDGVRGLGAVAPPRRMMLVMGGEAFGLQAADRAALDEVVAIPMAPGVDSLSVNAAAAVAFGWLTGSLQDR